MFIGVLDLASQTWTAGGAYSAMLARSLRAAGGSGVRVGWLSQRSELPQWAKDIGLIHVPLPAPGFRGFLPGEAGIRIRSRTMPRVGAPHLAERIVRRGAQVLQRHPGIIEPVAEAAGANAVLPLLELGPRPSSQLVRVGWIPDFQHVHIPQFFTREEAQARTTLHEATANNCDVLLVSSQAAASDARRTLGVSPGKIAVSPFPSLFAFSPPSAQTQPVRAKYGIPERYFLVANQFWAHKNHSVVVRALQLLKDRGERPSVVMTGMPADHRDPQNGVLSRLLQDTASSGVRDVVWLLGLVSTEELHGLIRGATAVIQPSMFEGWSTTVQDAIALGRPVICSDIPVHREQAPSALGFFEAEDHASLARLMTKAAALEPGPNQAAEALALESEKRFARRHGEALLQSMEAAVSVKSSGKRRKLWR